MAQHIKYLALSLQSLRLPLWCGFNPWPGNFCMPLGVAETIIIIIKCFFLKKARKGIKRLVEEFPSWLSRKESD